MSVFICPSEPFQALQCIREGQLAMQRAHSSVSCYEGRGQRSDIQRWNDYLFLLLEYVWHWLVNMPLMYPENSFLRRVSVISSRYATFFCSSMQLYWIILHYFENGQLRAKCRVHINIYFSLSLPLSILFLSLVYFILFHFVSILGPLCQSINLLFYFQRLSIAIKLCSIEWMREKKFLKKYKQSVVWLNLSFNSKQPIKSILGEVFNM